MKLQFSVNKACLKCGLVSALLLLLKFANGYVVCDLTVSAVYLDLATGVGLLIACGIAPLLALIMHRRMDSKGGICCKKFAQLLVTLLIFGILALSIVNGALNATGAVKSFEAADVVTKCQLARQLFYQLRLDPFDLCAGGSNKEIKAFYIANKPSFLWIQRGDAILQLLLCFAWIAQALGLVANLCVVGLPRYCQHCQHANQDKIVQDDPESNGAEVPEAQPTIPDYASDEWEKAWISPDDTIAMEFPTEARGSSDENICGTHRIDIEPAEREEENSAKDTTEQIVDEANIIKVAAEDEIKTKAWEEEGEDNDGTEKHDAASLPRESLSKTNFEGSFAAR